MKENLLTIKYTEDVLLSLKESKTEFEEEAQKMGSTMKIISTETREGAQLKDLGKVAAILRYEMHE